jgi:hypothetical protein
MIYRPEVIDRAKKLAASGWNPSEIQRLLERELGERPTRDTIKCWIDPEFAKRRFARKAASMRRAYRPRPRRISPDLQTERMLALRERGLSFGAIAIVSEVLWDAPIAAERVRYRLQRRKAAG